MKKEYGKVLVLMGGWSNERDISLISGKYVFESLKNSGIDVSELDLKKDNLQSIKEINPERVFIVLHGKGGEDGEIQKYLESLGIPYTGSKSLSSKLCMNKRHTKEALLSENILTPRFERITRENISKIHNNFKYPFIVKPSAEGSSIGVYIVGNKEEYYSAIEENKKISDDYIVEEYIEGTEYTVGIINSSALPVIKLIPPGKFYDFDAKYNSENMQYICPSGLENNIETNLKNISLKAFEILGCKGWGRVDLIIDNEKRPWVIELNTVPGMTSHSLVPMAAKEEGVNFNQLVLKILDSSFEKK